MLIGVRSPWRLRVNNIIKLDARGVPSHRTKRVIKTIRKRQATSSIRFVIILKEWPDQNMTGRHPTTKIGAFRSTNKAERKIKRPVSLLFCRTPKVCNIHSLPAGSTRPDWRVLSPIRYVCPVLYCPNTLIFIHSELTSPQNPICSAISRETGRVLSPKFCSLIQMLMTIYIYPSGILSPFLRLVQHKWQRISNQSQMWFLCGVGRAAYMHTTDATK